MTYDRSVVLCLCASVSWSLASTAFAAEPSIAECLQASDASLEHENAHRLRAARAELLACAAHSCPAEIRAECTRRVAEINEAIPTIVFEVKDAAGQELSDVQVTMDGEPLVERLEGIALPIDPGVHAFHFEAANRQTADKQFVILQAQKNRVELVRLADERAPAHAAETIAGGETSDRASEGTDRLRRARRNLPAITASVAAAALGVGTGFGVLARQQRDRARRVCPTDCVSQDGVERWHDAKRSGNVATASFAVAGTALAGALLFWLFDRPHSIAAAPQVGKTTASLAVSGRW